MSDYLWNPSACPLSINDEFLGTQWVIDEAYRATLYGRAFSSGASPCTLTNIAPTEMNHFVVLGDPSVQTGILQFLMGQAPDALALAPKDL